MLKNILLSGVFLGAEVGILNGILFGMIFIKGTYYGPLIESLKKCIENKKIIDICNEVEYKITTCIKIYAVGVFITNIYTLKSLF